MGDASTIEYTILILLVISLLIQLFGLTRRY